MPTAEPLRIHPSLAPSEPTSTALSIVDTACSDFFSFSAAKLYAAPPAGSTDPFQPALLSRSLAHILSAYPHWAGSLRLSRPEDKGSAYQKRFGRVWVDYASPRDPGVDLVYRERSEELAPLLPPSTPRELYSAATLADADIYPPGEVVVRLRPEVVPGPAFAIRFTRFSCGGVAIGFRISHTIADATSLNQFCIDWADEHRVLVETGSLEHHKLPVRPFDPAAVDAHALGDLDAASADEELEREYARVPRTAMDLWLNPESHPPGTVNSSAPPDSLLPHLDPAQLAPRGQPAPWHTWDVSAPVALQTVALSPADLARIYSHARASAPPGTRVTAHDALVAHFWRLSMRARSHSPESDTPLSLTPAIGVRARLDPPLPPDAVGSLFLLFSGRTTAREILSAGGLGAAAGAIRSSINSATPRALGVVLHHLAHEVDPIRVRPSFCGDEHLSMSTWIGAGSYDADFGSGAPVYAEGVLPAVDNMLLFEDVAGDRSAKWHERGARVKLALREDVMGRVLADPELYGPDE
ncbi:hypothetical protein Rhopal_002914-T1 [Rhodotorula paludigena]|uniref:Transferase family protein n=1 Tax=Rhodotorula paludigena TaxID=86838 RepID=A0AAV5GKA1_9BASI|nr:hypothetical protein Rhopal_002914-T1 [Rhodotorula paludigena]